MSIQKVLKKMDLIFNGFMVFAAIILGLSVISSALFYYNIFTSDNLNLQEFNFSQLKLASYLLTLLSVCVLTLLSLFKGDVHSRGGAMEFSDTLVCFLVINIFISGACLFGIIKYYY